MSTEPCTMYTVTNIQKKYPFTSNNILFTHYNTPHRCLKGPEKRAAHNKPVNLSKCEDNSTVNKKDRVRSAKAREDQVRPGKTLKNPVRPSKTQ